MDDFISFMENLPKGTPLPDVEPGSYYDAVQIMLQDEAGRKIVTDMMKLNQDVQLENQTVKHLTSKMFQSILESISNTNKEYVQDVLEQNLSAFANWSLPVIVSATDLLLKRGWLMNVLLYVSAILIFRSISFALSKKLFYTGKPFIVKLKNLKPNAGAICSKIVNSIHRKFLHDHELEVSLNDATPKITRRTRSIDSTHTTRRRSKSATRRSSKR